MARQQTHRLFLYKQIPLNTAHLSQVCFSPFFYPLKIRHLALLPPHAPVHRQLAALTDPMRVRVSRSRPSVVDTCARDLTSRQTHTGTTAGI